MLLRTVLTVTLALAPRPANQDPDWIAVLRKDVARIQLQHATQANHEATLDALSAALPTIANQASDGAQDAGRAALVEWLSAYVGVLTQQGKTGEAVVALSTYLEPSPADQPSEITRLLGEVAEDAALRQELKSLRALLAASDNQEPQDEIDAAVIRAWNANDFRFVQQLGPRSVEGLKQVIRAGLGEFPDPAADPLQALVQIDIHAADALLGELADFDGFYWKRRVLSAFNRVALSDSSLWGMDAGPNRTSRLPNFTRRLEQLLDDADLQSSVNDLLGVYASRMALTTAMLTHCQATLEKHPHGTRSLVKFLDKAGADPQLKPVYQALLRSPNMDARLLALRSLRRYGDNSAVHPLANDEELAIRFQLAGFMVPRKVDTFNAASKRWDDQTYDPTLEADYAPCLDLLLSDAVVDVRVAALKALFRIERRTVQAPVPTWPGMKALEPRERTYLPDLVSDERWLALAADPAFEVRSKVAEVAGELPLEVSIQVATMLAADPDRRVAGRLAQEGYKLDRFSEPARMIEPVRLLLERTDDPFYDNRHGYLHDYAKDFKQTHEGLQAFCDLALASEDDDPLRYLAGSVYERRQNIGQLEPGRFALVAERACSESFRTADSRAWQRLLDEVRTEVHGTELLRLAQQGKSLPEFHYFAWIAQRERDLPAALEQFTLALRGGFKPARREETDRFNRAWNDLSAESRSEVLTQCIPDPNVSDELLAKLIARPQLPDSAQATITPAVFERWHLTLDSGTRSQQRNALQELISRSAQVPAALTSDQLTELVRGDEFFREALSAIGRRRDPQHMPLLAELVREGPGSPRFSPALYALPGYLSDEAAELLLEGAALTDQSETREYCIEQLDKIREYQQARERWATRRVTTQQREVVIAELALLLESDQATPRIEALRALATWEAVELMPRIIGLLSDTDPTVASAAQAALDKLNAVRDAK